MVGAGGGPAKSSAKVARLAADDGTFTQASPSSTISSPTLQVQASLARSRSGISSATSTITSTVSPIFTGARKFSVCEM